MRVLLALSGEEHQYEDDEKEDNEVNLSREEPLDERFKRKSSPEATEVESLPEGGKHFKRPRHYTEYPTVTASSVDEDRKPPAKPSPKNLIPTLDSRPPAQLKMGYREEYRDQPDDDDDDPADCSTINIKALSHSVIHSKSKVHYPLSAVNTGVTIGTLAQQLKARGLEIRPQEGDGNCFFRAVSLQVYGDATMHQEVRQRCCDFMANDQAHFEQFINDEVYADYLERKRNNGVHANNPEIQAISELYSRPVEVYTEESGSQPINIFQSDCQDQFPIRVSYHDGNHYNAVVDPLVPTAGLGLGMPDLKPGLADQLQLSNAIIRSDEEEDVEKALKESRLSTALQQGDDLQRALKESSLADNRLDTAIFKSDVDATNFELEQAVLESSIDGSGKFSSRFLLPMSSSSISSVASIPTTTNIPLVASLPSAENDVWSIAQQGEEYPQTVEELVMNGFDMKEVLHAYDLIGDNFDDLLAFLVSNRRS